MADFPHTFTDEERRRGRENRAAVIRAQREMARQDAISRKLSLRRCLLLPRHEAKVDPR
jgi:hypothetical protein